MGVGTISVVCSDVLCLNQVVQTDTIINIILNFIGQLFIHWVFFVFDQKRKYFLKC